MLTGSLFERIRKELHAYWSLDRSQCLETVVTVDRHGLLNIDMPSDDWFTPKVSMTASDEAH